MRSKATWISGFKSVVDNGRQHSMVLDLPPDKNGTDQGPTALELAVMGLSGCVSTIFSLIAKNFNVAFDSLTADVEAEKADNAKTITGAKVTVYVSSSASEDQLQKILDKTMEACPVGQLYEQGGIEIKTELVVN